MNITNQRDAVTYLEPALLRQALRDQDCGRVVRERQRVFDHLPLALLRERQKERVAQEVDTEHQQRATFPVRRARDDLQHGGRVLDALEVGDLPGQCAGDAGAAARDGEIRLAGHAVDHVLERRHQAVVGGQHRAHHAHAEGDAEDDQRAAQW
jgi:hypothetical protein